MEFQTLFPPEPAAGATPIGARISRHVLKMSDILLPKIRGTNMRAQTLVIAHQDWELSPSQIAEDYDLTAIQVQDALAFYQGHRDEIDAAIAAEETLEKAHA